MWRTLRSTVEQYRSGEILRVPYDLSDRLERSIWTVLELYVDHVERRAILAAEEFDRPEVWAAVHPYVDHPDSDAYLAPLDSRRAWEPIYYEVRCCRGMHTGLGEPAVRLKARREAGR